MAVDNKIEIDRKVNDALRRKQEDTDDDNKEIARALKTMFILSLLTFKPSMYIFFLVLWLGFMFLSEGMEPKTAKIFTIVLFVFGYFMFMISLTDQ